MSAQDSTKQPDNMWRVRNVAPDVRKRIKLYAAQHGMGVGEALSFLITPGNSGNDPHDYGIIKSGDFVVTGDLRAAYEELKKRYE